MAILKGIVEADMSQVQVVWKDFPSPLVPGARKSAVAARCAQSQGKFWDYHDSLADLAELNAEIYGIIAEELGLDVEEINDCMQGSEAVELVNDGFEQAQALEIYQVPTIFVGKYRLLGDIEEEKVQKLIDTLNNVKF